MATSLRWSLWAGLATLALLVPGFFGNTWLYRAYRQRLDKALANTSNLHDACILLARQSGSRARLLAVVLANLVLAVVLVAASWPFAKPMHPLPRASGEVGGAAPAAVSPVLSAPAAVAAANPIGIASAPAPGTAVNLASPPSTPASAASEPMAPTAQSQPTPAASQPVARPSSFDGDLQTPGPAAREALAQDAAIRQHSRSARHPTAATAAVPAASTPHVSGAPTRASASAAVTLTPAPPNADGRPFLINVGLFAQQDNALRVHARLKAAGLPATSTSLETPNGPRTRVRVGPFTSRAQADAAAQRIRAMQLDAVVIRQ